MKAATEKDATPPDNTAVRVALWRALHAKIDPPPHVIEDDIGLRLVAPDKDWPRRGDMEPEFCKPFRASIVARARFIEDLVVQRATDGVSQYVILGAGLDSFAQRRRDIAAKLKVFEIDQPDTQSWKRRRLSELGFSIPDWLHFVPVDFERGESWLTRLIASGFDPTKPAAVASTGVSMYLSKEANLATLQQVASLKSGSFLAMTFLLPIELADPSIRPSLTRAAAGAEASGTPFLSYFAPNQMLELAREAGFANAIHVSAGDLAERYFNGRSDGLRPPQGGEEILVASN